MAEAGQGRGEMDVLAGYIAPPIDENGCVRFTVREHVTVTASLESRRRGRGAMAVLHDRTMDNIVWSTGVRFAGRPGQTVTILLEQIPERGAMDALAGYIEPPINEDDGVRFTVRERVTVVAFLERELEVEEGRDPMDVLDDRGVRFPGRPGQTVTILLERMPLDPEFKDGDADAPTAAAAAVTEPSASKTDEEPGLEESSEKVEFPPKLARVSDLDVPKLVAKFRELKISQKGKKKEKTAKDEVSDGKQQAGTCITPKERRFSIPHATILEADKLPGMGPSYKAELKDGHGITMASDVIGKYLDGRNAFILWASCSPLYSTRGVGMQEQHLVTLLDFLDGNRDQLLTEMRKQGYSFE